MGGTLTAAWTSTGFTHNEDFQILGFDKAGSGVVITHVGTQSGTFDSHWFVNPYFTTIPFPNWTLFGEYSALAMPGIWPDLDQSASLIGIEWQPRFWGWSVRLRRELRHYTQAYYETYFNQVTDPFFELAEELESVNTIRNYMVGLSDVWGHHTVVELKKAFVDNQFLVFLTLEDLQLKRPELTENFHFFRHGVQYSFSEELTLEALISNRVGQKGENNFTLQIPARTYFMLSMHYRF